MPPLLYYITDRRQFPGDSTEHERRLLAKIAECAAAEVDYIQLREKDLSTRALEELANQVMIALGGSRTKLLINSRTDVALACGAHGVHLPGNDLPASEVRAVFFMENQSRANRSMANQSLANQSRGNLATPVIAVATHSQTEVEYAEARGADFAVFAPVFEKDNAANPEGLNQLRQICSRSPAGSAMPVFALGGVTLENAQLCLQAGAAGIAGIRLFQQNEVDTIVKRLRDQ